jgi:CENP-S associating Centromere protein X
LFLTVITVFLVNPTDRRGRLHSDCEQERPKPQVAKRTINAVIFERAEARNNGAELVSGFEFTHKRRMDDSIDANESDCEPFSPALVCRLIHRYSNSETNGKGIDNENASGAKKRITAEASVAAGELLRLFVLELRHRAAVEAECEAESTLQEEENIMDEDDDVKVCKKRGKKSIEIRADHIAKVAAELLMDFT